MTENLRKIARKFTDFVRKRSPSTAVLTLVVAFTVFSFDPACCQAIAAASYADVFQPPAVDISGRSLTGTEAMFLIHVKEGEYPGVYFATSNWQTGGSRDFGPQIVRIIPETNRLQLIYQFPPEYMRVDAMIEVRVKKPNKSLATIIVVGLESHTGAGAVYSCDLSGSSATWKMEPVSTSLNQFRALAYYDLNGVDTLFAGGGQGERGEAAGAIYTAVYDPEAKRGNFKWDPAPFFSGFHNRVMAFAVVPMNGRHALVFSAKPSIYVLNDKTRQFETVLSHPPTQLSMSPLGFGTSGFRGLSAVPGSDGQFLAVWEDGVPRRTSSVAEHPIGHAEIWLVDLEEKTSKIELDINDLLTRAWGVEPLGDVIGAYNDVAWAYPHGPSSPEPVGLVGLFVAFPPSSNSTSGWFLSRSSNGSATRYTLHGVRALASRSVASHPALGAVRSLLQVADSLYLAGFGAFGKELKKDTAWVYTTGVSSFAP
jgi:hypothetical protein